MHDVVGVVFTPDAIRDRLTEDILDEILSLGSMDIVWVSREVKLSPKNVALLYRELVGRDVFPLVVNSMTWGKSIAVLVTGESAYTRIKGIKGKMRLVHGLLVLSGLRLKYRNWSFSEFDRLPISIDSTYPDLLRRIFEFRVHAADNLEETARILYLYGGSGCRGSSPLSLEPYPKLAEELDRLRKDRKDHA